MTRQPRALRPSRPRAGGPHLDRRGAQVQRLLGLAGRLIISAPKPPVHLLALPARQAASRREGRRSPTHGSCGGGSCSAASGGVRRAFRRRRRWAVGGGCCRRHLHTDTNPVRLGNNVTPARCRITGPGTREASAKTNATYARQFGDGLAYDEPVDP